MKEASLLVLMESGRGGFDVGRHMHESKILLIYLGVNLLHWGTRWHPDFCGTPLLSLLENNHLNKAYLD